MKANASCFNRNEVGAMYNAANLHYYSLRRRRDQLMWIEYEFEDLFGAVAGGGKADVVDFGDCRCSTVRAAPVADNRFDDVAILDFCVGLPEVSPIFVTTIFVAHLLDYYHSLHS